MFISQLPSNMALNASVFLAIICYGLWGIFDKKALEKAPTREVVLTLYLARLVNIPTAAIVLFLFFPGRHLSWNLMFWAACASTSAFTSTMAYTVAMTLCEASYVLGVTAAYGIVFQFLATLWLGEAMVPQRIIGATIIALGVGIIGASGNGKQPFPKGKKLAVTIISLVMATFFWGLAAIFDKRAIAIARPFEVAFAQGLCDLVLIAGLFCFHFKSRTNRPQLANSRTWLFCALSALVWMLGNYSYFFAFAIGSASYVIAITSAYPLVMYVFALVLLRESMNRRRLLGVALVTIGTAVVQLTQSSN
jgi:bacterial/archaeal transporter family protein